MAADDAPIRASHCAAAALRPTFDASSVGGRGRPRKRERSPWGCAIPMRCWASIARRAQPTSRAPSGAWRKNCIPTPTRTIPKAATRFAEINAAYEILGDEDKRKAFDRGEIDAEGKPKFHGFEGFGAGAGAGRPGGFGAEAEFESFSFGPEGFTRRRGAAAAAAAVSAASRTFSRKPSAAWAAAARGAAAARRSSPRISAVGADVARRNDGDAAGSGARRHPAPAAADRQGRRRQDSGRDHRRPARSGCAAKAWPGQAGAGDVLITVVDRAASDLHARRRRRAARPADHALRGGARRQGARADARQAGRNHGPAVDLAAAAPSASRARAFPPKPATATSSPPSASCCPSAAIPSSKR